MTVYTASITLQLSLEDVQRGLAHVFDREKEAVSRTWAAFPCDPLSQTKVLPST